MIFLCAHKSSIMIEAWCPVLNYLHDDIFVTVYDKELNITEQKYYLKRKKILNANMSI